MKIYVLTCVNHNADIEELFVFASFDDAKARMEEDWAYECEEFKKCGAVDFFSSINMFRAQCGAGNQVLNWRIHSREL